MKKGLITTLKVTLLVLAVVLIAFGIHTIRVHREVEAGPMSGQEVPETKVQESTAEQLENEQRAIDVYRNLLLDQRYKVDGEYGFDNDCYFLVYDFDRDGEQELLVTGPTGVESLYASVIYDYEDHVLSFGNVHGDPIAVANGAIDVEGWYSEGQGSSEEIYRVAKGASLTDNRLYSDVVEFEWSLVLYADMDYEGLDTEGITVVYLYPTDAESVIAYCK